MKIKSMATQKSKLSARATQTRPGVGQPNDDASLFRTTPTPRQVNLKTYF
jgi:hypothetical protein